MGSIARQAVWNTVFTYLGIALGFVNVVLLYPKVLAPGEFGLTRLMMALVTVVAQVVLFGAENTVIRFFPVFRDPARQHRGLLGMILLFGTVVTAAACLLLWAMHGVLSHVFGDVHDLYSKHGMWLLPMLAGETFFILLRAYSRALRRTVPPIIVREMLLRLMQMIIILYQAWRPLPFDQFIVVYSSVFVLATLLLAGDLWRAGHFHLRPGGHWLPTRLRRSMFTYGRYTLTASLTGVVLGNIDQIMIGALLGDGLSQVAFYAVAFYFGSVIAAPGRALHHAAMPAVADAWKRRDMPVLRRIYSGSALTQTVVSGFLFVLMWGSIDDLFAMLPPAYAGAAHVATVVGLAYFLNSMVGLNQGIIAMSRSYRLDAWTSIVLLVLNVAGNFLLVRTFGIVGAAVATLLSMLLVNIYRTGYLFRRYSLWPFDRRIVFALLLVALMAMVLPWVPFTGSPLWDIVLRSAVITIAYWPAAYVLGLLPDLLALVRRR
jgi:O-antigen/teichoic acid export membrane protein